MNIVITRLKDSFDCETCGYSYADGAEVEFICGAGHTDKLSLIPSAHCFGGGHYDEEAILVAILEKLGHTVAFKEQDYDTK